VPAGATADVVGVVVAGVAGTVVGTLAGGDDPRVSRGPLDTERFTEEPGATAVPGDGLEATMIPAGKTELAIGTISPAIRPAAPSRLIAATCVIPVTAGTATV
jgi:hypothetical protein